MAAVPSQDVIPPCIGARFMFEHQGLWGIKPGNHGSFGIDQAMQRIENMGLGRHAIFKSQFNRAEDGLLIMLQHQGQDFSHFPVASRPPEQLILQGPEGSWQFGKRRAIAQGARFALDDRQIMPPVIHRAAWHTMRTRDDPVMHAQNLPFGDNAQLVRINPQADRTIGKGGRHAVTVAFELDQAGW